MALRPHSRSHRAAPASLSSVVAHASRSPLLVLPLLLVLAARLPRASSVGYVFPSECAQPTSDSCPACCKNLRNLAPAGEPRLVVRQVKQVDQCIAICSNHTYFALSNKHVCGCFDECSVIEVPPSPFAVTSGLVSACLGSCFDPEPQAPMCSCPEHSACLPIKDGVFKCCCKAPFDQLLTVNGKPTCTRTDSHGATDRGTA